MLKTIPLLLLLFVTNTSFSQKHERTYILRQHIKAIRSYRLDSNEHKELSSHQVYNDSGYLLSETGFLSDSGRADTFYHYLYTYDLQNRLVSIISKEKEARIKSAAYYRYEGNNYNIERIDYTGKIAVKDFSKALVKKHKTIVKDYSNGKLKARYRNKTHKAKYKSVRTFYNGRFRRHRAVYISTENRFKQKSRHSLSKGKVFYDSSHNKTKIVVSRKHIYAFTAVGQVERSISVTTMIYNKDGDMLRSCISETGRHYQINSDNCHTFEYIKW